jgi:hypothetical protein
MGIPPTVQLSDIMHKVMQVAEPAADAFGVAAALRAGFPCMASFPKNDFCRKSPFRRIS